jgi:hypothetical protein
MIPTTTRHNVARHPNDGVDHRGSSTASGPHWRALVRRSDAPELLDGGAHDAGELLENHRDMARVNRWLGGADLTIRGIQRLTGSVRRGQCLTLVDVGTGLADIPRAVIEWGRQRGLRVSIVGLDLEIRTLRACRLDWRNVSIRIAAGEARHLPLRDDCVDIALSSMTLHHLDDGDAITALREMARVARLGIVVNDLTRSLHGLAGAWALSRLMTGNRLTRHDAPLSVRRARTLDEMAALACAAGLREPVFDSTYGYRVAMTVGVRPW